MSGRILRIGTRGSALALWQARAVAALLTSEGCQVELTTITTAGDRLQRSPEALSTGKGVFVKEIEDALLDESIDLAVHSAKDMSAEIPAGLAIAAVLPREDPRDALVLRNDPLGERPTLGTSSIRRISQLLPSMPDARFAPIRGNVDTRLRKLDAGEFDAIVLAVAGMKRLGFGARISVALPIERCVPAPGQGIVAVQTRGSDAALLETLHPLSDAAAAASLEAERALVIALGGGCQLPLGGIAVHDAGGLEMHAIVASADGRRVARHSQRGSASHPRELGRAVAEALAKAGALGILNEVR